MLWDQSVISQQMHGLMTTQCNAAKLMFHELDTREGVGRFDGGEIASDAGGLLLRGQSDD